MSANKNSSGKAWVALILVILALSVFMAAGFWQLHRAHYKDALEAKATRAMHDAPVELTSSLARGEDVDFHAIHVRGEWNTDKTIFLDNKIENGVVGYHVITPLRIAGSDLSVLVNRGWVAALPLRSQLPKVVTPQGSVEVIGIARVPSNRFLELSSQTIEGQQARVWQNLTIDRFRQWSSLALQPVVVFQQNGSSSQLQTVSVAPEASGLNAERHRGYALTWFGLAAVTLVLAIAAKIQSRKK